MNAKRLFTTIVVLLLGGLACRFVTGLFPPSPEGVITGFSGGSDSVDEDFVAIEEAIESSPQDVRAAALAHVGDEDVNVRFAALYALARTAEEGESMDALVPFLSSEDISERIMAAEALLVRGEKAAIPVLIAALDSEDDLAFRDPPQQAWDAASFALIQFTEEDLGLVGVEDLAGSAAAKPAWEAWWEAHGESLVWDAERGVYTQ